MHKAYKTTLFIFRRDLRLDDNTGLLHALEKSELVIPIFIFDPRQVDKNSYKSENALKFMRESLDDLAQQLESRGAQLYYFYGRPEEVLAHVMSQKKIEAVFVNHDYTPFSRKRDDEINSFCTHNQISFYQYHDALLVEPEKSLKKNGEPYTIFTPFYKKNSLIFVEKPQVNLLKNYFFGSLNGVIKPAEVCINIPSKGYYWKGGTSACRALLKGLIDHNDYQATRDLPSQSTTHLSAHLKFGTCSIREVYHVIKDTLGKQHLLLRQLYWRDFFTCVAFYFPHVFGHAFREKYDRIVWKDDHDLFKKWCEGKTGFPIVDAGMRELNHTGFMHNRVRMIVASFLVKDLHIDWRWGERYFAQLLVDYDPAVNNGNWQWAASTGCDAQPYFRIFNPWTQQKKFDPLCVYIKRWVPELAVLTPNQIHQLEKVRPTIVANYPKPIVHHGTASSYAKKMFKVVD